MAAFMTKIALLAVVVLFRAAVIWRCQKKQTAGLLSPGASDVNAAGAVRIWFSPTCGRGFCIWWPLRHSLLLQDHLLDGDDDAQVWAAVPEFCAEAR